MTKRTERCWAGHFCGCENCRFRRNTLLEFQNINIVVSTVGLLVPNNSEIPQMVNSNGYFETMAFEAANTKYKDADTSKQILDYESSWFLDEIDEIKANQMHENMVDEMIRKYNK